MAKRKPATTPSRTRPTTGRNRRAAAAAAARRRARRRTMAMVGGIVAAIAIGVALVVASRTGNSGNGQTAIAGLQTFKGLSRDHVTTPVSYPQDPPVGGDHSPVPQTCGAYTEPVPNEQAVHSMEHGAVWIAYRPDLAKADVDRLDALARQTYVLVSPYPGLDTAVVASAWERQLRLDSATDPRLAQFVDAFRQGPQTPEPGAACTGAAMPQSAGNP